MLNPIRSLDKKSVVTGIALLFGSVPHHHQSLKSGYSRNTTSDTELVSNIAIELGLWASGFYQR